MADLRVDIKTTADLAGANAATDALKATTAAANALGTSSATATAATVQTQDALKETSKQATNLGDSLQETARQAEQAQAAVAAVSGTSTNVASATAAAAKTTAQLGSSFSDLIRRGSPAHELLDGVLQGSLRSSTGVLALTRAVTGLFRGFSAGGIGLFVTALAGATGVALLLAKNLKIVGESAEELKKRFEENEKALQKVAQANLGTLETSLKHIGQEADKDKVSFDKLLAAKEKLDNAEKAAILAENRANPKLTEEQKVTNEVKIRADFDKKAANDRVTALKKDVEVAQTKVSQAKQISDVPESADRAAVNQLQTVLNNQAKKDDLNEKLAAATAKAPLPRGEFGPQISPEIKGLLSDIKSVGPSSDQDLKAAQTRVEETTKATLVAREAIKIEEEKLRVAKQNLDIEVALQNKLKPITQRQERAELTPKIADAIQADRDKKAALQKEQANPEVIKLTTGLQGLDSRIAALKEEMLRSQESSRSPQNVARQTQIDTLQGQREQTSSQIDVFNRTPTKTDLRKTDLKAAGKDVDKALKLDTKPIEDAEQKKNDDVLKLAADNNSGLRAIADTISALPPPPKPDTTPVMSGLIEYNGQTIAAFKGVNQNFVEIGKTLRSQAQQIEALSRQIAQATP